MVKLAGIAAVALALAASPAFAQDPIVLPTTGEAGLPVHDGGTFDWNGFYAGVYGTLTSSPASGGQVGGGISVGFNRAFDFVLVGGEVALQTAGNDVMANSYLQAVGRGGVLVTDNVLVFGVAGLGTDPGPGADNHLLAGGGLEVGLTDSVSLRGQYLHGFPVTNASPIEQVTLGAEFHF